MMSADAPVPARSESRAPDPAAVPAGPRVLVVDDEPMVVRAVSQILARSGYDVLVADGPSTAEAQFAATGGAIDLLLTDVVMPEGGGRRLAERLRQQAPALRVLFMSGFTEHDSIRDGQALAGPLLSKPFTAVRLETAVRDALDLRS